jgi:hypothetical protein
MSTPYTGTMQQSSQNPSNTPKPPNYHSYLLRCWHLQSVADKGTSKWRFILEEIMGNNKIRFESLSELIQFLENTFTSDADPSDSSSHNPQN